MLVENSDDFFGVQKCNMLEKVVETIPYLHMVKYQSDQLKTKTDTAMNYEQYYELLILYLITHDKKIDQDTEFSSKSWQNFYDIEHITNDDNGDSFYIYYYIYMVQ